MRKPGVGGPEKETERVCYLRSMNQPLEVAITQESLGSYEAFSTATSA